MRALSVLAARMGALLCLCAGGTRGAGDVPLFLTFDSGVKNIAANPPALEQLDFVWGATESHVPLYRKSDNPHLYLSHYIPFMRGECCRRSVASLFVVDSLCDALHYLSGLPVIGSIPLTGARFHCFF